MELSTELDDVFVHTQPPMSFVTIPGGESIRESTSEQGQVKSRLPAVKYIQTPCANAGCTKPSTMSLTWCGDAECFDCGMSHSCDQEPTVWNWSGKERVCSFDCAKEQFGWIYLAHRQSRILDDGCELVYLEIYCECITCEQPCVQFVSEFARCHLNSNGTDMNQEEVISDKKKKNKARRDVKRRNRPRVAEESTQTPDNANKL